MEKLIIDYTFADLNLANPDATFPATVTNGSLVAGPGTTSAGELASAFHFAPGSVVQTAFAQDLVTVPKFCVQVVFKATESVTTRENLVECTGLPFALFLEPSGNPNEFQVVVAVANSQAGWSQAATTYRLALGLHQWYVAELVYDTDTLAIVVNGNVVAVSAFPDGRLQAGTGNQLVIGAWVDGSRWPFKGDLALVRIYEDIPATLEALVDAKRNTAEWFITYKYHKIRPAMDLGAKGGDIVFDGEAQAYIQPYQSGLIMYPDGLGAAFEMHGSIWGLYQTISNKTLLGYLASDEIDGGRPGSRKSLFQKGGIYWSGSTGAVVVSGQIYLDYENMGAAKHPLGLPLKNAEAIAQGWVQEFQGGRIYFKNGRSAAFEMHGAILQQYLLADGLNRFGFPVSHETDVLTEANQSMGKYSELEGATIYWSPSTGAHIVYGAIRVKYRELKGPLGILGFPTSDESDIPGVTGPARYNTFEGGSILWYDGPVYVCTPFKIYVGVVDTQESEGMWMGQNDLYMRLRIRENGHELYHKRIPDSGDYGGHNVVDIKHHVPTRIVPNNAASNIEFNLDVWESDGGAPFGGGDDHIGTYSKVLNVANAWGLREKPDGIMESGPVSKIKNISWALQPEVPPGTPFDFWGVTNKSTPELSYGQYAAAFADVDSETEVWDATDWLEKAFYEIAVKGIASSGNCFGMSLESIYSWKGNSRYTIPLSRFTQWESVRNDFNIRHAYQVGAVPIWWFIKEFATGQTHDPVSVFHRTREAFHRGCDPILNVTQNYDFSGAPHAVRPIAWDDSTTPWKITIMDPNHQNNLQTLTVDPAANAFNYKDKYKGSAWAGGRLHYMPYDILNHRQRTPVWEAILMILAGTVIILGDNAETESITDLEGNDLNGFHDQSGNKLNLLNTFVPFKGYDRTGVFDRVTDVSGIRRRDHRGLINGELWFRMGNGGITQEAVTIQPSRFSPDMVRQPLGDVLLSLGTQPAIEALREEARAFNVLGSVSLEELANPERVMELTGDRRIADRVSERVGSLIRPLRQHDYRHEVRSRTRGPLSYQLKAKLGEYRMSADVAAGEVHTFEMQGVGTSQYVSKIVSPTDKTFAIEYSNKLGLGSDRLKLTVRTVPAVGNLALQLHIKPGLGGIDIITGGTTVSTQIEVESQVSGTTRNQVFTTDIEGGVRILPSMILNDNQIKVGKIDNLFGNLVNSRILRP